LNGHEVPPFAAKISIMMADFGGTVIAPGQKRRSRYRSVSAAGLLILLHLAHEQIYQRIAKTFLSTLAKPETVRQCHAKWVRCWVHQDGAGNSAVSGVPSAAYSAA
jgi:hypothetical protein